MFIASPPAINPTTKRMRTASRTCHLLLVLLSIAVLQVVHSRDYLIVRQFVSTEIASVQHHIFRRIEVLAGHHVCWRRLRGGTLAEDRKSRQDQQQNAYR